MIKVSKTGQENEFAGCLYSSATRAQVECVKACLTGCETNADADVLEHLEDNTNEEILNELARNGWEFPVGTDLADAWAAVEGARAQLLREI